jgi:hypothetical protein
MGTVTYITKITNPRIWVRSKIFMTGRLSGTNSLRGAEADTPFTLASKLKNRKITFLLIYYQCCGSGIRCLFDPWILDSGSGMGKKSGSGSGIRIGDEQPKSYTLELRTIFGV